MKKKYLLILLTVLLSGCTMKTEEVRPEMDTKTKLNFYSEQEKAAAPPQGTPQTPPPQSTPQAPPQAEQQSLTPPPAMENPNGKTYSQAPELSIRADKKYTAVIKTDLGDIDIELNAEKTPVTVNNFVFLTRDKFYDNTIFHRAIKGFMIQGGDPRGDGTGGPGYKFNDEPFEGQYERGTVAMANAGPNTNGSQFFIMHQTTALSPNYVIFGKVTKGMEIVDKIAEAAVQMSRSGENSQPVAPINVRTIAIEEKE